MGSRKLLAIAAFAAVAAAACVNGDATTGQVKDAMRNAGADDEQAECIGNSLEGLNQEQLNEVAKAEDLTTLAGVEIAGSDEDLRQFLRDVLAKCLGEEDPEGSQSQNGDDPASGEGSDTTEGEEETPSDGQ